MNFINQLLTEGCTASSSITASHLPHNRGIISRAYHNNNLATWIWVQLEKKPRKTLPWKCRLERGRRGHRLLQAYVWWVHSCQRGEQHGKPPHCACRRMPSRGREHEHRCSRVSSTFARHLACSPAEKRQRAIQQHDPNASLAVAVTWKLCKTIKS